MADQGVNETVASLRRAFASGVTKTLAWREKQLLGIERFLSENEEAIVSALQKDLGKPRLEALAIEIISVRTVSKNTRKALKSWTKPTKVPTNLTNIPSKCFTIPQPLGVVLIISPFNYPLMLALEPLIGAIAAGNAALVKPSEISSATTEVLSTILPRYVDSDAIKVMEGGIPETTALLEQKWDKIFYTGNGTVGRIVAAAAAKHLTPVALELGGKSPVVVDATVDIKVTARRIAFGRFLNGGQTCVGSDYILVEETIASKLVEALKDVIIEWYGPESNYSPHMARIVNERHFDRVSGYLDDPEVQAKIVFGGKKVRESCFISPTLVRDAPWDSALMREEIFGPVLPIQSVSNVDEAIARINEGEKPLALYLFTRSDKVVAKVLNETSSGGVCVNDTVVQGSNQALPFGGVGESGYGNYHGKYSFEAFSHTRSVMQKDFGYDVPAKFPPYNRFKENLLAALLSGDVLGVILLVLGFRK